jgi:ribosomal protein L29
MKMSATPEPARSIQNLAEEVQRLKAELQRLKDEQNKGMSRAIYVGMNNEEAMRHDERRKRIYELYEDLLRLYVSLASSPWQK